MQNKLLKVSALMLLGACATAVGTGQLGNNSSQFAHDGECDDPRFAGGGMAASLSTQNIGRDADDCGNLLAAQRIRPQRTRDQWNTSQCSRVSYGNNSSQWARDGECDDPRFTGPGVDDVLLAEDLRSDARDCRALCDAGSVWLK